MVMRNAKMFSQFPERPRHQFRIFQRGLDHLSLVGVGPTCAVLWSRASRFPGCTKPAFALFQRRWTSRLERCALRHGGILNQPKRVAVLEA